MINQFEDSNIKRWYPQFHRGELLGPNEIGFYWYTGQENFGDWITPYLVKRITGREVTTMTDSAVAHGPAVLAAGSIMRLCGPTTIVWGSGIRDRDQHISAGKLVRSVRGPLTRQRVLDVGGECPPIYGDPALLLPRFYSPSTGPKYALGIIPHVSQYRRVRELFNNEADVAIVDLSTTDIEGVVDEIAACEYVVSSSLHGIIVSNAYGIPVRWIKFDNNIRGDDTKFYDHFASIGRLDERPLNALVYRKIPSTDLISQIEPYEINVDQEALWRASVFHNGEVSKYVRYVLTSDSTSAII
jgi:hypothetical protein